jgi:tetratricopeptide (TPR) repeat protein
MDVDNLIFKADKAIDDGEIEDAKNILLQIISEEPKFGQAYSFLGWLYRIKFSDEKQAEMYYKHAIDFSPEYPLGYLNYIYLLRDRGRVDELEEMLKKAEKVKSISRSGYYDELGTLYELKKDYKNAIKYYSTAIEYTLSESSIEDLKKHINRCIEKRRYLAPNRFVRAFRVLFDKE